MPRHDAILALTISGLLAAAPANADAPAPVSGLMTFPGVTVERGSPVGPAAAPTGAPASRIYVDTASGRVRERTPEDARAEAAADELASPSSPPELVEGPAGIVGVRLDPRAGVRAVVTRTDDGRLVGTCVEPTIASPTSVPAGDVAPAPEGDAPPASSEGHDDAR